LNKICIISPAAYLLIADSSGSGVSGGAEIQLVTLGRNFLKNGWAVDFIVNEHNEPDHETHNGLGVYKVPLKHLGMSNLNLPFDILRFMRTLVRINADIYVMKLPRHMLLPLGLYVWLFGKKVVFIGQVDGDADKTKLKHTDSRIASLMYRCGLFFTHAIVAQTESQKKSFSNRFKGDIRVIRNILTMDREPPGEKDKYILWVGNSGKHKQPELFLNLAAALPEYEFKMIMSLSSQRADDGFIRDRANELKNLEYLGAVPFAQMLTHYKKAALLVSTSYSEGFPNVFLQAWQFETPTISLNIDPDDVIQRNKLGRLSHTFDQLVKDIIELQERDNLRLEMGKNARVYAEAFHSKEVVMKQYIKLFSSLS
jgi:glycosyltransferase involved in cell wall biosynthesis